MAKRQSNDNTPQNVVRIDGEGKVHANSAGIVPLCKFLGHDAHTWVKTTDAVDCGRCINLEAKRNKTRERLEYAANARDTQDMDFSQGEPLADWERKAMESASKGEPVTVPMAEVLKAVTPVKDSQGETVTVPVDYDNPSAGRRELDASKGERVLGESTYRVREPQESKESQARRESARDAYMSAMRNEAPQTAEAVQALIRRLQTLHNTMTGNETEAFSVVFHEPKNGECPGNDIPPIPEGVHPHTWELAHDGNTQGARDYHTRQAQAQRKAFLDAQEAMEESRKVVSLEHNEENGYDVMELDKPPF